MALNLADTDQVTYTLNLGNDAAGQPAQEVVSPVWSVDNNTVVGLTPSGDGLSCVVSAGAEGVAVLTVTGALASGANFTDSDTITVRGGAPVAAPTLQAGTPEPKATAQPAPTPVPTPGDPTVPAPPVVGQPNPGDPTLPPGNTNPGPGTWPPAPGTPIDPTTGVPGSAPVPGDPSIPSAGF